MAQPLSTPVYSQAIDGSGPGNTPLYVGYASPGILQSAAGWMIYKIGYDGNGNPSSITWATITGVGIPPGNLIWNSRASYTYI